MNAKWDQTGGISGWLPDVEIFSVAMTNKKIIWSISIMSAVVLATLFGWRQGTAGPDSFEGTSVPMLQDQAAAKKLQASAHGEGLPVISETAALMQQQNEELQEIRRWHESRSAVESQPHK